MPQTTNHATTSPSLSAIEEADIAAGLTIGQDRHHPAVRAAAGASEIADQPPLITLCGAVLGYGLVASDRRAAAAGARMLTAVLLATALKAAIKRSVGRTRPHVVMDAGHYEVQPFGPGGGSWHSFPSGHTAGSVAAACAFARVYPRARAVAYTGAGAIGAVQILRGAHYPLDVLAGAALGAGAETLVAHFWRDQASAARQLIAAARRPPG